MSTEDPVAPHIPANMLLAVAWLLNNNHAEAAVHVLIRAEDVIARVVDPINYLSLMNHCDKLWRHHLINSGLRPAGSMTVPPKGPTS